MNFSISELISYYGGILGIFLCVVLLTISKGKKEVRLSLAFLLLVASLMVLLGALNYSGKIENFITIIRWDSPIHYLFGPAVYIYTLATFSSEFKYKKIHLLHLLPFAFNIIQFLPLYLSTTEYKLSYYAEIKSHQSYVLPIHYLLKTFSLLVYVIAQFVFLIKSRVLSKFLKEQTDKTLLIWFFIYFMSQLILIFGISIDNLFGLTLFRDPYRFAINMTAFFLCSIIVSLLLIPSLLYGSKNVSENHENKYKNSKLSDDLKVCIYNKLHDYLNCDQKIFLNENLSLQFLATELEVTPQQLSQVINEKYNANFNDLINTFRIEESKNLLISPDYSKLTIEAIAQKSGFHSKSAFYTAFKKHTGTTPKNFITFNAIAT